MRSGENQRGRSTGHQGDLFQQRVLVLGAAILLAMAIPGCESLKMVRNLNLIPSRPVDSVLEGDEIDLISTRFVSEPRRIYTRGDHFLLRISFDPDLVNLPYIKTILLWSRDHLAGPWKKIASFPSHHQPAANLFKPPRDGSYGLWVSVIYQNGQEFLIPKKDDLPLVWLYVDRSPPKVTWLSPKPNSSVEVGKKFTLRWGSSEMRFGDVPATLEWSPDGGANWSPVAQVKATTGTASRSWRIPASTAPYNRTLLVRLTSWDLVGNQGTAILPLKVAGAGSGPVAAVETVSRPSSPVQAISTGGIQGGAPDHHQDLKPTAHRSEVESSPVTGGPAAPSREKISPPVNGPEIRETMTPLSGKELVPEVKRVGGVLRLENFQDGTVYPGGTSRYIFFSTSGLDGEKTLVTIEWKPGRDDPYEVLARSVPARDGKLLWRIPEITTEDGFLRLTVVDPNRSETLVVENSTPVCIDILPPLAEVGGVRATGDGSLVVSLNCRDLGPAGLEEVQLFVTRDEGATYQAMAVVDSTRPVMVQGGDSRVGFRVWARDRVGNATPRIESGTRPEQSFEPRPQVSLAVEDFENEVIRGGDQHYLFWRFKGPPDRTARVDVSYDGGNSWEPVKEVPAGAGKLLWIAPGQNCIASFRVQVEVDEDMVAEKRTRPVRVDATPPQLQAGQIPPTVTGDLVFPLAVTDPGGAGVESVTALVRPAGGAPSPWVARPDDRVAFDLSTRQMRISVVDLPEGSHELLLLARDRVGNGGSSTASSAAMASFLIDRTPVAIQAVSAALPWVEGMTAAVQLEMDLEDAKPPLWLEEQSEGGWSEILRWDSLTPGEDLFRFPVPEGQSEYKVRFGLRDEVGNVSYAVVGPRPVEPSIRLSSLREEPSDEGTMLNLKPGDSKVLSWSLHPAHRQYQDELRVVVAHQGQTEGDWVLLYDDLPPSSTCVWTVPEGDQEEHQIRITLFHHGKRLGESRSGPFTIFPSSIPSKIEPSVVEVNRDSLYYSSRAETQLEKYRDIRDQYRKWFERVTADLRRDIKGNIPPEELEKISPDLRRQGLDRERSVNEAAEQVEETFMKALSLDRKNYHASYGMAKLLRRSSPENSGEMIRYLEQTVEIKPDHAPALNDLGASLILNGDFIAAETPLQRAILVDDRGSYHYNLALALFHQKKTTEARSRFHAALEKGGSTVKPGAVYYYIVSTYVQEGDKDEARRQLDRYGEQIPRNLREPLQASLKD